MTTEYRALSFYGIRVDRATLDAGLGLDEDESTEVIADLGCRLAHLGTSVSDDYAVVVTATYLETGRYRNFARVQPARGDVAAYDAALRAACERLRVPRGPAAWWLSLYVDL